MNTINHSANAVSRTQANRRDGRQPATGPLEALGNGGNTIRMIIGPRDE